MNASSQHTTPAKVTATIQTTAPSHCRSNSNTGAGQQDCETRNPSPSTRPYSYHNRRKTKSVTAPKSKHGSFNTLLQLQSPPHVPANGFSPFPRQQTISYLPSPTRTNDKCDKASAHPASISPILSTRAASSGVDYKDPTTDPLGPHTLPITKLYKLTKYGSPKRKTLLQRQPRTQATQKHCLTTQTTRYLSSHPQTPCASQTFAHTSTALSPSSARSSTPPIGSASVVKPRTALGR